MNDDRLPVWLIAAFVLALNVVGGGISNGVTILSFLAAGLWLWANRPWPNGLHGDPVIFALLAIFAFRSALPPYGTTPDEFTTKAVTNVALLFGLYALVLAASLRTRFSTLLWVLAIGAALCAGLSILVWLLRPTFATLPMSTSVNLGWDRLTFVGRAGNPILGVGGIVPGLIAAVLLLRDRGIHLQRVVLLWLMICVDVAAIYLAGSRGPIFALVLAAAGFAVFAVNPRWIILSASGMAAWTVVTAVVLLDGPLKRSLCTITSLACRPSNRSDAWAESIQLVIAHPWLGVGGSFRFSGPIFVHPHNGLIGVAVFYGLPILAAFLALLGRSAWNTARLEYDDERHFVAALLIFSLGFMGSDLSDPFRFINTHYLFLWLPVFVAAIAKKRLD